MASRYYSSCRERGETTTQMVLALPVVLMCLLCGVHFAVLSHLGHVASVAADAGARVGAHAKNSRDFEDVANEVERIVQDLSATLEGAPQMSHHENSVAVTVTLNVPSIVPFLPRRVARTATVPLEDFRAEEDR
ncbi:MAG: pilus assembly protein [Ilumatobacteraceae bacterium]|nr:pilus assembly protein [Ilumatobacteraceae bacterium]